MNGALIEHLFPILIFFLTVLIKYLSSLFIEYYGCYVLVFIYLSNFKLMNVSLKSELLN